MSLKGKNESNRYVSDFVIIFFHSKATNFAVLSQFGVFSVFITVITSTVNFWLHAINCNYYSDVSRTAK